MKTRTDNDELTIKRSARKVVHARWGVMVIVKTMHEEMPFADNVRFDGWYSQKFEAMEVYEHAQNKFPKCNIFVIRETAYAYLRGIKLPETVADERGALIIKENDDGSNAD